MRNPSFYGIKDNNKETIQKYLVNLIDENLYELVELGCIQLLGDEYTI